MNEKNNLELDIIYVNYFTYFEVIKSIGTLYEIVKKNSISCSIYLIDNSYDKDDFLIKKKLSDFAKNFSKDNFKIFYNPSDYNLGFAKACNKGAFLGNASKILFLNCDTDLSSLGNNGLVELINKIKNNVVILGPQIISENGQKQDSCFRYDPISIILKPLRHIKKIGGLSKIIFLNQFLIKRANYITYGNLNENISHEVDWISGCFMIIERKFFEQVNGFDERFFLYFEDIDICRKARLFNKKVIYDPTQKIIHKGKFESASKKGIFNSIIKNPTTRMHLSSWIKYILKWKNDYLYFLKKQKS